MVGLGKIGLALAAQYVAKGHRVIGCDINEELVQTVNHGEVPPNSEDGLAERVREGHAQCRLSATTNTPEAVGKSEVVVVIYRHRRRERRARISALDAATDRRCHAGAGTLVLYETTLPLGTTRTRFGPMLENLVCGWAWTSTWRLAPSECSVGRTFEDLRRYPKVVGG